ncbi:MAG: hypothetical protein U9N86_09155 [Bacteroidota bacterium]|nr:hypothetical protein [Bacteroidota bacterium]
MAVALALDWTYDQLPETTISEAKEALIEKGIKPSWPEYEGENIKIRFSLKGDKISSI